MTFDFQRWQRDLALMDLSLKESHEPLSQADGYALAQASDKITTAVNPTPQCSQCGSLTVRPGLCRQCFETTPEEQLQAWWNKAVPIGRFIVGYLLAWLIFFGVVAYWRGWFGL